MKISLQLLHPFFQTEKLLIKLFSFTVQKIKVFTKCLYKSQKQKSTHYYIINYVKTFGILHPGFIFFSWFLIPNLQSTWQFLSALKLYSALLWLWPSLWLAAWNCQLISQISVQLERDSFLTEVLF